MGSIMSYILVVMITGDSTVHDINVSTHKSLEACQVAKTYIDQEAAKEKFSVVKTTCLPAMQ